MASKSLTLRLPAELYEKSSEIAEKRGISFNTLVQQCLQAMLKQR